MTQADRVHSTPPTNTSAIDDPKSSTATLHPYLEPSPILADGGAQVGKLPGCIPLHDLRGLGHPESPIKAIRAKCLPDGMLIAVIEMSLSSWLVAGIQLRKPMASRNTGSNTER